MTGQNGEVTCTVFELNPVYKKKLVTLFGLI